MSRLTSLVAALALLAGALVLTGPAAHAVDYDCGDFDNQAQAQKHLTAGDPHRLDADGDGIACDSLPCPCSTSRPKKQPASSPPSGTQKGVRIVRVVDGDTVVVRMNGARKNVRLLGINAPEVSGRAQCYGTAATRVLRRLLPVNTRVRLVADASQARVDRYGRLLRYVVKRKLDIDRAMVRRGAARVYVYGKPFKRVKAYRAAQRKAQKTDRGLWRRCA